MENISTTIFGFSTYDTVCIALAITIIVLFIIQLALYFNLYGRISSFRMMDKRPIRESEPAISVIVPMFVEDSYYLDTTLATLLTQDYKEFEVVLIYVGKSDDFFNEIKSLQKLYPNLTPIQIDYSPRYPVSTKIALNVGIKSAKYDFIVTTSYDAAPSSERWLSLLAKGFLYGDVVLGYSGIVRKEGFANFIFREYQINKSLAWISAAIRGKAYAGSRNALGFKKELYFNVRGFNHLDMNAGEDDLFVQQIATPDNVSVVLSPRATCIEQTWGGFAWWLRKMQMLRETRRFYKRGVTAKSTAELVMRTLFFIAVLAAIIVLPWEFKAIPIAVAVLRYLLSFYLFVRNTRRLGEEGLSSRHIIYDFIEPALRLFVIVAPLTKGSNTYQN
ncbi:MAG: glycosyltransferase [Alistipes sp.]|nr:glycosyltransferase [Alistipes sp.]